MNKILIVDDSSFSRKIINNICTKHGYQTEQAVDGLDALDKIPNYQPDCILLDLLMPNMDGFAVIKHLRQQKNEVPIIVLSADIQTSTYDECMQQGATEFINKPPQEAKIISTLERILANKV